MEGEGKESDSSDSIVVVMVIPWNMGIKVVAKGSTDVSISSLVTDNFIMMPYNNTFCMLRLLS